MVLGFQDAPFPLPAAARFVEPEEPKLQHPMVCLLQALPTLSSERTFCAWQQCTVLQASTLLPHALVCACQAASVYAAAEKVKVWWHEHKAPPPQVMAREHCAAPLNPETEDAAGCYRTSWWQRD